MFRDIYGTDKILEWHRARLQQFQNGDLALRFLEHLQAKGLSNLGVIKYANCLPRILNSLDISKAEKNDVVSFIASINASNLREPTKAAYRLVTRKLFQFLKYGNTSRDTPFPPEVSWIKINFSETKASKEARVTPDSLLSPDDVVRMLKVARTPRDEAMVSVLYEGGFRPGEMLNMTVSSVQFLDKYCIVSTRGKTGQKRIPLVASYRSLLRWLSVHPRKNEPNAPLWCALDSGHRGKALSYKNFRVIIKSNAKRAGLSKDAWPYLFRHSQLTNMADKLTESKLELFAGWTLGSRMSRRYVHWSGRDLDRNILQIHGIMKEEQSQEKQLMKTKECPRCGLVNGPAAPRCEGCGLVLDRELAIRVEDDVMKRLERVEETLNRLLSGQDGS
jgi:site-specific recombinase XerD/ribosomal protein L40E